MPDFADKDIYQLIMAQPSNLATKTAHFRISEMS
jgi:hypothetical protein